MDDLGRLGHPALAALEPLQHVAGAQPDFLPWQGCLRTRGRQLHIAAHSFHVGLAQDGYQRCPAVVNPHAVLVDGLAKRAAQHLGRWWVGLRQPHQHVHLDADVRGVRVGAGVEALVAAFRRQPGAVEALCGAVGLNARQRPGTQRVVARRDAPDHVHQAR